MFDFGTVASNFESLLRWPDSSTFADSFYFRRDATGGGPALLLWLFKLDAAPWTARGAAPNQGSNFSFNSIYTSRAAPGYDNYCKSRSWRQSV